MNEKLINAKLKAIESKFGDGALIELVKTNENKYTHFDKSDYVELIYYKEGVPKHVIMVGDVLEIADYFIAKINAKYEVSVMKRINEKYEPLVFYGLEDFI